ncbi:response regulator [Rhodobacteraceae bacterium M385]|nr:response regulator [Rhodobacteraceae bacterium M385]
MRILAVDDDPIALELMKVLLKQAGHKNAVFAESSAEALDILRRSRKGYDCLIFDINMPDMDGIELCAEVRTMPKFARTPVLMLTARSDFAAIAEAFRAGANDYVTKPFDVADINSRLDVAIRMSKSQEMLPILQTIEAKPDEALGAHPFKVSEPVKLPVESGLIDSFSLGNYLAKLTKIRVKSSIVFAIKVANIQSLYLSCTTSEFTSILSDVSQAIYDATENPHTLSSYIGDGNFICITREDILETQPDIGRKVEAIYGRLARAHEDRDIREVTFKAGRAIRPNGSRSHRVKPTINRALSALDRTAEVRSA